MSPSSALVVHNALAAHSAEVTIVTQAWSSLLSSSILVWLEGDIREIRPTANLHFRSLEQLLRLKQRRLPWEVDESWMAPENEPEVNLALEDYKTVLRLISRSRTCERLHTP